MTLWSALVIDSEDDDETLSKYVDDCGDETEPEESEGWEEEDDLEQII
jgi:hypothetical protein